MNDPLPVTVIGGYLGSGKTTLVNHLLRNANGLRLAVLVNEFGELAIDEDLIEATGDDIISIAGGCICCSFGDDLTAALLDMAKMQPRPDHILIEASGVAIPGSIVATLGLLDGFSSDGIVVLADAETIRRSVRDKYMGDTILRQLNDADIVLLNKTDLVSAETLEATKQWLTALYPQTRVVDSVQGAVPPETVLGSFLGRVYTSGPHHEAANLDMLTLSPRGPLDADQLAQSLASNSYGIIRAKGFVTSLDGQKTLIQIVGQRWQTSNANDEFADGIVCLGFKEQLKSTELSRLVLGQNTQTTKNVVAV
ncbi:MAG: G3E family GTPase [Paracoccaceae bacterium]|jgi:G3E family GTPase